MAPSRDSLTHTAPRITQDKFASLLKAKNSPAYDEAHAIYDELVLQNVDPSFMLAQYRVESQMGTAGWAVQTQSIGNMLWDANLCLNAVGQFAATNGYTYAKYLNQLSATKDYCNYLAWYRDHYGLTTIYGATARWIGKTPGSQFHLIYLDTIINDMTKFEFEPGDFYEVGDRMIYGGPSFDKTTGRIVQKYPVVEGKTILYKGTDGTVLKTYQGPSSDAWFLGPVQGSWSWGVICIGTPYADKDVTWCYIKSPDKTKVKNV